MNRWQVTARLWGAPKKEHKCVFEYAYVVDMIAVTVEHSEGASLHCDTVYSKAVNIIGGYDKY